MPSVRFCFRRRVVVWPVGERVGEKTCSRQVSLGEVTAYGRDLSPIVQKLDSAIHRINHYPADKYLGNQLRYPLDRDLSIG